MMDASKRADKTYWIVVADESQAIIYTRNMRRGPLQKLLSLDNAAGRKKTGELLADRGGRSASRRAATLAWSVTRLSCWLEGPAAWFSPDTSESRRAGHCCRSGTVMC